MKPATDDPSFSKARWQGERVIFEIDVDGEKIPCAMSRAALQDLSGSRQFKGPDLLRSFEQFRTRIEAIARRKLQQQPESALGTINLWAGDLDEPPLSAGVTAEEQS